MAGPAANPPQRPTKRRRTRKARVRTNAASSSDSSSDSSDSDPDSDAEPKPLPVKTDDPSSDSSSASSTDSSSEESDLDSDSDSTSTSSDSSGSSNPAEKSTTPAARRAPLPDQQTALAEYTKNTASNGKERRGNAGEEVNGGEQLQFPSRKEEKRAERLRRLQEREERRAQIKRYTPSPLPSDEDTEDEALNSLARTEDGTTDYSKARAARIERSRKRAERLLGQPIPDPIWVATGGDAMAASLVPKKLGLPPLPTPAEESNNRIAAQLASLDEQQQEHHSGALAPAANSLAKWDSVLGQSSLVENLPAQDTLADIWMRSVADQFGEELNAIREVCSHHVRTVSACCCKLADIVMLLAGHEPCF